MTRLLIGYDASGASRASIAVAAALFPGADAVVATVHPPPPTLEAAAMARIALPDSVIHEGIEHLHAEADRQARATAVEGAADVARAAGLNATPTVLQDVSTWRALVVAHAWHSPVRHSLRGRAFVHSGVDTLEDYAETLDTIWSEAADETADEGAAYELALTAEAGAPESGHGDWQTLLEGARAVRAAAILVGSRGRGPVAATVLGSVASGLVHAAALPVLVVPTAGT